MHGVVKRDISSGFFVGTLLWVASRQGAFARNVKLCFSISGSESICILKILYQQTIFSNMYWKIVLRLFHLANSRYESFKLSKAQIMVVIFLLDSSVKNSSHFFPAPDFNVPDCQSSKLYKKQNLDAIAIILRTFHHVFCCWNKLKWILKIYDGASSLKYFTESIHTKSFFEFKLSWIQTSTNFSGIESSGLVIVLYLW